MSTLSNTHQGLINSLSILFSFYFKEFPPNNQLSSSRKQRFIILPPPWKKETSGLFIPFGWMGLHFHTLHLLPYIPYIIINIKNIHTRKHSCITTTITPFPFLASFKALTHSCISTTITPLVWQLKRKKQTLLSVENSVHNFRRMVKSQLLSKVVHRTHNVVLPCYTQ